MTGEIYYVGAKEMGRTLGIFPRLNYFALFSQPLKLGGSNKDLIKWEEGQLRAGRPHLARINAQNIGDLADGIALHASTSEALYTCRNEDTNGEKCAVILGDDGEEKGYLRLEDIKTLRRGYTKAPQLSWENIFTWATGLVAVTQDGEKRCKTYVAEDKSPDFIVRHYSQIPTEELSYNEGHIAHAQRTYINWTRKPLGNYIEGSPNRDLNLREQGSLAQRIGLTLKKRERDLKNRAWKWPVKLVVKGTYPDVYEVVRGK